MVEKQHKEIVLVGHGSRRAAANQQFINLVESIAGHLPDFSLSYGFIEIEKPNITDVLMKLAESGTRIVVIPVMLFNGGHIKNDLAILIDRCKKRHPEASITLASALGQSHVLCNFYYQQLSQFSLQPEQDLLLAVGRGASDVEANGEFFSQTRKIAESSGLTWSLPSFIGITTPLFDEVLSKAISLRMKRIFVLPYFLYPGVLVERVINKVEAVRQRFPWIKFEVLKILGGSPALAQAIREKATDPEVSALPCGSCQYRIPIGKFEGKVGGFETLLWSVRHMETHKQATQAEHSHKPIKKHILVCANHDCAQKGSLEILHQLRRQLRSNKVQKEFKVTRTSCMGKCGEGPTVAIYPDGIWYRSVTKEDVHLLVKDHLLNNKLVEHRIDMIM